jgi:cytochrome c-type biogenesis protein CcmH
MLWVLFAIMCLAAAGFAALPFARDLRRRIPVALLTLLFVGGLAAGIYAINGSPDIRAGKSEQPDVSAMVGSLAARLEEQPDDIRGWKMLGRSYMALGNFEGAVAAYEKAVQLEDAQDAQTLVDYGVALARAGGEPLTPKAISVFENAIALAPTNPEALFWGGIAAVNRGDRAAAADRWERLLATDPPPEVRTILTERIAAWRGVAPAPAETDEPAGVIVVDVGVSAEARAALPADASVFVIARDPAQPSPPIAVTRRRLSDLPARVALGDRDAMIPGRNLSGFDSFEIVVRASASGNPTEGPGDWFGRADVEPAATAEIAIEIGERVP